MFSIFIDDIFDGEFRGVESGVTGLLFADDSARPCGLASLLRTFPTISRRWKSGLRITPWSFGMALVNAG